MAREAQTIVANGAKRLSGFILSLSRSEQRRKKRTGNLQPYDNKLLSKTQSQSRQVVSGIIWFFCFPLLFISVFLFAGAQLFGKCQSSFASYIPSWLKWLRCQPEEFIAWLATDIRISLIYLYKSAQYCGTWVRKMRRIYQTDHTKHRTK